MRRICFANAAPFSHLFFGRAKNKSFFDAICRVYIGKNDQDIEKNAREANLPQYLSLSRDLIECATWLRRFAQTEL